MSYDVAVWVGPQPVDNAEALARYEQLCAAAQDSTPAAPPLLAFLEELRRVLPDDEVWASEPSEEVEAGGSLLHLNMTASSSGHDLARLTDAAHRHGLVVFDLQGADGGDVYLPLDDGSGYADHIAPPRSAIPTDVVKKRVRDSFRAELKALGLTKRGPYTWRRELDNGHNLEVYLSVRSRDGARDLFVDVNLHLGRDAVTGYLVDWRWDIGRMLTNFEWRQVNRDLEDRRAQDPGTMEESSAWLDWDSSWNRYSLGLPISTSGDLEHWLPVLTQVTVRTCRGLLADPRQLPEIEPWDA